MLIICYCEVFSLGVYIQMEVSWEVVIVALCERVKPKDYLPESCIENRAPALHARWKERQLLYAL